MGSDCEMPCYHPITAWIAKQKRPNGKNRILFKPTEHIEADIQLPCGQCVGCRLERSRQWALRMVHESKQHDHNAFLTLTYDEEHLPEDGGLNKKHFQDFMKRYRKHLYEHEGKRIKFFHCGEYGDKNLRPHYHAAIFGHDFNDKSYITNSLDRPVYESPTLNRLWGNGNCIIGTLTFESAAYIARYIMKKVNINENTPENLRRTYERVSAETGEIFSVCPEYTTMSRGGRTGKGIGQAWFEQFESDVYPSDYIIINGHKCQPPRYYDNQHPHIDEIKRARLVRALEKQADNTPDRLRVKEICKLAQIKSLKRNLSED